MKRYFYFIIPIIICVVSFSFNVRTKAAEIEPFNMLSLNTENSSYIDTVKSQITGSKSRYWGSYANYANVPNDYWIVVKGYNSSGGDIVCLCPNEYVDSSKTTTITCDAYNTGENGVVSSAKLKFNQYTAFPVATNAYWVDNNANVYGWKTYNFLGGNWSLLYCNIPIYYNGTLIITVSDDINIPTIGQGFGSLSSGGHSSGTSPFDQIKNGVTFNGITSGGHSSGNSVTLPTTPPTFDFTSHTENLLGQIINNTNSLIGNTSLIFGALQTINNNLISGISALFNAVSALNDNIVQLAFYDQEVVDSAWEESSCKEFLDSTVEFTDTIQNTVNGYSDHFFEGAGPDSLVIPIDLTVWEFSTEDYGDFAPFDQIYYMRFPFLDETKALWQPFLLGLLYFALVSNLYFDLPNIIRGAVK